MTDLRKLLDEATPGPWVYPAQKWARDACIEASGDAVACPGTGGAMSYSQDICTMTWRGTPEWDANASLIALAPQLAAALIKAEDALIDATAHLVGAESAYREFAKRHQDIRPKAATDPFFTTRVGDFRKAADRARAAYLEISALTGGNDD
jgi:hypothetical protein